MAVGQDGDRRVAILPFDLQQSNLPLMSAFPILMANMVNYLSPPGVVQSSEVHTGSPESLLPLPQVEGVRVVAPTDQATALRPGRGPMTYRAPDLAGRYRF